MKRWKLSDETKAKVAASKRGSKNPRWLGNSDLQATHAWLKRNCPKQGVCEHCGKEGKTEYAFKHHPKPYTRDVADYEELCRRCHMAADGRLAAMIARNRGVKVK